MTKDYRSRAQPQKKPESSSTPAWVPFFYGFLLGATLIGIGWVVLTPAGTPLVWPDNFVADDSQSPAMKTQAEAQPERPKFTFYTILPEMEVVISDEEARPPASSENNGSANKDSKESKYRLQVGSFKKLTDADRQKARLALLGVEAEIQKVNIGEGDIYYRVLTQAFSSKKELNKKRSMFQKNKINSLIVQVRN